MDTINLALLFIAGILSAAISGAAGFGGALLLLPLLAKIVGPTLAVPLLTVAQLVGNLSRAVAGFRQIAWRSVGVFLLTAVPTSVLGSLFFIELPSEITKRLIGVAILGIVVFRFFGGRFALGKPSLLAGGGAIVGFLSGIVGSAGPLGAAIFLELRLPPTAYIASEASTAVVMHAAKTFVYGHSLLISSQYWFLAFVLGVAMVLGTFLGKQIIGAISPKLFRVFVTVLLIAMAMHMIVIA